MYIRKDKYMPKSEQQNPVEQETMPQDQYMSQGQQQIPYNQQTIKADQSANQQGMQPGQLSSQQTYPMSNCPMVNICPFSQTCPIAKGNIEMPSQTGEKEGEMIVRQHHIQHPAQYYHMGHPHPYHHPYYHPYYSPYYPPYFNPYILTPWLVGSLLSQNYDDHE